MEHLLQKLGFKNADAVRRTVENIQHDDTTRRILKKLDITPGTHNYVGLKFRGTYGGSPVAPRPTFTTDFDSDDYEYRQTMYRRII